MFARTAKLDGRAGEKRLCKGTADISRLRALVHGVLLCSLLTTWLGKPVDVVASLGTPWLSCVRIPNDRTSCPSDRGGIRVVRRSNQHLANCKAKFTKPKVSILCFAVS